MKPKTSELLWNGKIQLGDEPGVFGDAIYGGLCVEYPFTVEATNLQQKGAVSFTVMTSFVKIYAGYQGHKITLYRFDPTTTGNPASKWTKTAIKDGSARITSDGNTTITIPLSAAKGKTTYISVAIEVDTDVASGLYDDFLINEFSFKSENYLFFASFGFKYSI